MFHALLHLMGVLPRSPSSAYNFWSGFGSDIGEVVLIGGMASLVRHHNCHAKGCWRLGHTPVAGGKYKVCHRHHPDSRTSRNVDPATIRADHAAHIAQTATPTTATPSRAPRKAAHPETSRSPRAPKPTPRKES